MDPLHCNLTCLFAVLLRDELNEYAYDAELAGINYSIESTIYGLLVGPLCGLMQTYSTVIDLVEYI